MNADRVLPPAFPTRVAGLARAVDDYVVAFRAVARLPGDVDLRGKLALCEAALAAYRGARCDREDAP